MKTKAQQVSLPCRAPALACVLAQRVALWYKNRESQSHGCVAQLAEQLTLNLPPTVTQ
jgi:hypothetical protein